jgi:hypothetical protein
LFLLDAIYHPQRSSPARCPTARRIGLLTCTRVLVDQRYINGAPGITSNAANCPDLRPNAAASRLLQWTTERCLRRFDLSSRSPETLATHHQESTDMKKKNVKKALPKFQSVTLGPDELSKAVGGLVICTTGTVSVCHVDGTTDDC